MNRLLLHFRFGPAFDHLKNFPNISTFTLGMARQQIISDMTIPQTFFTIRQAILENRPVIQVYKELSLN
ncbi:MAG: hypothetical protein HY808_14015 [Nitrospirae bacterium]|nr:hypothetical protein [Nitrospirota bacterium]